MFIVACAPTGSGDDLESSAAESAPTVTAPDLPTEAPTATTEATPQPETSEPADEELPPGVERSFSTDFSLRSISFDEILSGGPPKDGIPAIDSPSSVSVSGADEWLNDVKPVVKVDHFWFSWAAFRPDTRIYQP
ncbi:MAG TPA: hypothetical protein VK879_01555 [Candidatus Sulfomarinibacteraceae bacterium]|nr:hypothetical protein [Candidatus Sulfomarinibacteraceae bacterium]